MATLCFGGTLNRGLAAQRASPFSCMTAKEHDQDNVKLKAQKPMDYVLLGNYLVAR
jgi:hypothetical protein